MIKLPPRFAPEPGNNTRAPSLSFMLGLALSPIQNLEEPRPDSVDFVVFRVADAILEEFAHRELLELGQVIALVEFF